jgi:hypothetical protein
MKNTTKSKEEGLAGFSLKTLLITLLGILLFILYVDVLINGENSLSVLNQVEESNTTLTQRKIALKNENQRLQKIFFELKQLEPKE